MRREQAADPGHPWVVAGRLRHARISSAVLHGAELDDLDDVVVEAVARLAEQHRAAALELDGERDHQAERQEQDEEQRGEQAVLEVLDHQVPARERPLEDVEHGDAGEAGQAAHRQIEREDVRAEPDIDRQGLQPVQDLLDLGLLLPGHGDDDLVDPPGLDLLDQGVDPAEPGQAVDGIDPRRPPRPR